MDTATALDPEAPMTPAEIAEAVADALRTVPDPVERYRAARDAEPLMKAALAQVARSVVNEMWDEGLRSPEIAKTLGVSRQRVDQMVSPDRMAELRAERLANREDKLKEQMAKVRSAKRRVAKKTAKVFADAQPVTPAELQRTAPVYASGVLDVLVGEREEA